MAILAAKLNRTLPKLRRGAGDFCACKQPIELRADLAATVTYPPLSIEPPLSIRYVAEPQKSCSPLSITNVARL